MTDERIAELMGWPAFLKLEQCGPEDLVTRVKNLVATAEREEREKADASIADLERKLACARAETVAEVLGCYSPDDTATDYMDKIRSIAPAPSGYVCVETALLEFMLGEREHPESKEWFGEGCESRGTLGAFWWRKYIRQMIAAARGEK